MSTMERTRIKGKRVEDYWPLAPIHFGAARDYEPVGPFRAQAWHETHDLSLIRHEIFDSMEMAVGAWNKWCVPPQPGYFAYVLDETFTVIAGVSSSTKTIAEHGRYGWWGVRAAWAWMEQHSGQDMLDLAVWEATAEEQTR